MSSPSLFEITRVHTVENAGHRRSGVYKITGKQLSVFVQGNAFTSCGMNLLFGLGGLQYASLDLLEPFLETLKKFKDDANGDEWYAKRFLLQPNRRHLDSPFPRALLEKCTKLCEYNNLAHTSDKQYVYMLSFEKD